MWGKNFSFRHHLSSRKKSFIHFVIINYLVCEHFSWTKRGTKSSSAINRERKHKFSVWSHMKWHEIVAIFQLARCKLLRISSGAFLCVHVECSCCRNFFPFIASLHEQLAACGQRCDKKTNVWSFYGRAKWIYRGKYEGFVFWLLSRWRKLNTI